MRIYSVSNNNNYNVTFGVNLQSKKLRFDKEDFFVRIKGYGHDSEWAEKICETADTAVDYIREKCNFEETLKKITVGVREANQHSEDEEKRDHTGILRIEREGWQHNSNWGDDLITTYSSSPQNRYRSYASRLDYTVKHPLYNP